MTALWMLTTLTALAGGPMLDVTGSCPGPITFDVMGLTPGTRIAVLAGAPGSDTLPGGPCADTRTDLSSVRLLSTVPDWDRDGQISLAPFVPGGACGRTVQVIDLTTCLLTNTEVLGAVDVEVDLDLTPGDGGVVAGDDPYWADKGYVFTADTTFDIAGGSWQINMPADGFVRMSVYEWPELGLIARGTATYGSGAEEWLRSDLDFTFVGGEEYLVTFYTNRASSSVFTRKDSPSFGYAVDGRVSGVTGWSSYNSGDEAPEGTDADGYLGNTWAPYQVLHVVE